VDSVSDPLLLRKSGSAGNRTRNSGSAAKYSDHQTTEALSFNLRFVSVVGCKANEAIGCCKLTSIVYTDPEARVRFSALPEKKVMGLERGPV
jgi:hypothetical protein